jgi:transcriptional regulator with XRE-family HTH domain
LASGVDRAHFGHIERATKSPTLKTVWKIADALHEQPSKLLQRAERLLDLD